MNTVKILLFIFIGATIAGFLLNLFLFWLWRRSIAKSDEKDFDAVSILIKYKKLVSFLRSKKHNVEEILRGE